VTNSKTPEIKSEHLTDVVNINQLPYHSCQNWSDL